MAEGPHLSVYLDLSAEGAPAHKRFLAAVDRTVVSDNVVDRIDALVRQAEGSDDGLFACVASSEGPMVATTFPDPPTRDIVEVAATPRLIPFIESEQSLLHHVIAVIDPAGISIIAAPRHGDPIEERLIGNNPVGAAELIAQVAHLTDTSMVLIVGTPETLDAVHPLVLRDGRLFCPVVRIEIDNADDTMVDDTTANVSPTDTLVDELVRQVADRSARRVVEALRLFRYFESHQSAADGTIATVHALRSGKASMLLLHGDPDDERQGWFGTDPHDIGYDITDVGGDARIAINGRLVDIVLRSALGQKVPVIMVPRVPDDRLADGMGVVYQVDGFADAGFTDLVER